MATTIDPPVPEVSPASGPPDVNLVSDRSFLGLTATQFLGAFNDNLYKQVVLLLSLPMVAAAAGAAGEQLADQASENDLQGWATFVFALPFVLFSGYAGYLADRNSKRTVIVLAKVAEIVIMAASAVAFLYYDTFGAWGTWLVLFVMATQSAFFGPGKYGILPELFSKRQLPTVNGIILMTTFLAIIFGVLAAGAVRDAFATPRPDGYADASGLWRGSMICVGLAVLGTLTSLLIRRLPAASPQSVVTWNTLWVEKQMRQILWRDRPLLKALLVSCVFWMISGICLPVINRVGVLLQATGFRTSLLAGATALGIMLGSIVVIAMQASGRASPRRQVTLGLWGMVATLGLLSLWTRADLPLLGYWGSFAMLLLLGVAAAVYSIPLQVFLQDRPPDNVKGRMIATMNQANFIGIMLSGPLYQVFQSLAAALGLPINSVFGMMALLLLPLAAFYRLRA